MVDLTALGAATPPYTISRVVLHRRDGKNQPDADRHEYHFAASSPGRPTIRSRPFTPATARVETQELRYTWLLTVIPSTGGGSSNVEVTVFFNRPLTPTDEQVFQGDAGRDGVADALHFTYSRQEALRQEGGLPVRLLFGRWYRIVNVLNDTGSAVRHLRRSAAASRPTCWPISATFDVRGRLHAGRRRRLSDYRSSDGGPRQSTR